MKLLGSLARARPGSRRPDLVAGEPGTHRELRSYPGPTIWQMAAQLYTEEHSSPDGIPTLAMGAHREGMQLPGDRCLGPADVQPQGRRHLPLPLALSGCCSRPNFAFKLVCQLSASTSRIENLSCVAAYTPRALPPPGRQHGYDTLNQRQPMPTTFNRRALRCWVVEPRKA